MMLYNYCWMKVQDLKGYINNKKGQGMVEYILIIALIAVVLIVSFTDLGKAIKDKITQLITNLA